MEEWRDVVGYERLYQVSNLGRVKSLNYHRTGKEKLFTPWRSRCGYLLVSLRKNGKKKGHSIHILVYSAFKGPIPKGMQVNHVNEEKSDNRLENLNLMAPKENCNWGTRNERIGNMVAQFDMQGNLVDIFKTAQEAENQLGVFGTSIISCCREKHLSAGGYKWKYVKDIHPFVLRLLKDVHILTPLFARPA